VPEPPVSPRQSFTEMTELVLPHHTNAVGSVFGGTVLSWIDVCGAIAAQRHCRRVTVTAAIDELVFLAPIKLGNVVRLVGRVNAAFRTSLEVEVRVEIEDRRTLVRAPCVSALLTFVGLDDNGRPAEVPPLLAETDDDALREREAGVRRAERLARKPVRSLGLGPSR
jgi:acyl-CoA hydrolase